MKKIFYFMTMFCAALTFVSCELKDDKEYFDENASQRSSTNIENVEKILKSAPNGWLMEYYGNLGYGGFNVMVKFEGDQATFASEQIGPSHKAGIGDDGKVVTSTSHFKLEQSMGTILSFDDYNPTFHYYSMPNNPDGIGETDEGMYGDFEFRVMKCTPDSIVLSGKKHQNRIYMLPIPADKPWENIITEAEETEYFMSSRSYTLEGADRKDTTDIQVVNSGRCLIFTYKDSTKLTQTVTAPYIVNKDGFEFYAAVNVNGYELDGLLKGDTDEYFLFKNNPNLQLTTAMPTLAENLTTGTWYIRHSSLGDFAQPKWDAMLPKLKTAGKNKTEIKIYYAMFGVYSNKLGIHMLAGNDSPYYGFTTSGINEAGDQITFKWASTQSNKDGRDYYQKYGWKDAIECFFGSRGKTFKLSCDYLRKPSYITLTDVDDPTNVITVWADASYYMDDNMAYYQDN